MFFFFYINSGQGGCNLKNSIFYLQNTLLSRSTKSLKHFKNNSLYVQLKVQTNWFLVTAAALSEKKKGVSMIDFIPVYNSVLVFIFSVTYICMCTMHSKLFTLLKYKSLFSVKYIKSQIKYTYHRYYPNYYYCNARAYMQNRHKTYWVLGRCNNIADNHRKAASSD